MVKNQLKLPYPSILCDLLPKSLCWAVIMSRTAVIIHFAISGHVSIRRVLLFSAVLYIILYVHEKHNLVILMLPTKCICQCKWAVYERHFSETGLDSCGHYCGGISATPPLLQSALSTAARSLNVMSTHCEIAIKNVINKWWRNTLSQAWTDRGTSS